MSKFCGVISKRLNSEEIEPMRFDNLETLTNWLICETEPLETDFKTKSSAVQDQQMQVMHNEGKLNEIHDVMLVLKQKIDLSEQELAVNDANIRMLESNIKALEDYTNRPFTTAGLTCGCPLVCDQHQHLGMLNLLQNTDQAVDQLNMLMNEIHELEPYVDHMSNPFNTISSILDCHVTTLKQTEKNLDRLADKMHKVEEMFNLAMKRLVASRQYRSHSVPPNFSVTIGDCTRQSQC
ncbi:uncharacterized protein [Eurosta solidaginis]|uniref:uncharacterized protein n=1 Tax=Eurosta solidaginis TaxID=178769 RepID=UPI0035307E6D